MGSRKAIAGGELCVSRQKIVIDRISMGNGIKEVNIFTSYRQVENQFTNGLISLFYFGNVEDPYFLTNFLMVHKITQNFDKFTSFQVLGGYEQKSTADAKILGNKYTIQIETKIVSATIRDEQVRKHLQSFKDDSKKEMRLIFLTPDDSDGGYIRKFKEIDQRICHLKWKSVYAYLEEYIQKKNVSILFRKLVQQFLDLIRERIFQQDVVGIIAKASFGKHTGVYANKYLDEMKNGKWIQWNTPRQYKNLEGTGRKLLIYDKNLKAITLEVEIETVRKTNEEEGFPWSNYFLPGSLEIYKKQIPLENIQKIQGFENFSKGQAPYRNLTHEQYDQLMKNNNIQNGLLNGR